MRRTQNTYYTHTHILFLFAAWDEKKSTPTTTTTTGTAEKDITAICCLFCNKERRRRFIPTGLIFARLGGDFSRLALVENTHCQLLILCRYSASCELKFDEEDEAYWSSVVA